MTITVRRDAEIYDTEGGWFRARWHFSFDHYVDPQNDSFGALRVFNDDRLIPGAVWPLHPHRDVEGVTYVVEGTFGHEDNVGGPFGPLPAGSVQLMTLGSGALHSELNASKDEPMRFIQIWILPDTAGLPPGVEQRVFTTEDRTNRLLRVIGPEGGDVVLIHQDASVHVARLEPGHEVSHPIGEGRGVYAYLIDGAASFDGEALRTGDAAKVTGQPALTIGAADATSELILVDVPLRFEPVGRLGRPNLTSLRLVRRLRHGAESSAPARRPAFPRTPRSAPRRSRPRGAPARQPTGWRANGAARTRRRRQDRTRRGRRCRAGPG